MPLIKTLDTTLRDGEQTPSLNFICKEKILIFKHLLTLKIDTIEVGFPAISNQEKVNIQKLIPLANKYNQEIQVLTRLIPQEIQDNILLLEKAQRKRMNIFFAASDIHLKHKYNFSRKELKQRISHCFNNCHYQNTKFTLCFEDATRTAISFLLELIQIISLYPNIDTISLPDTLGITTPAQYGKLFKTIKKEFKNRFILSAHTHNDLGLATANTLSAISNGAEQIEGVMTGLGERAGNAALEEVLVILKICKPFKKMITNINYNNIYDVCRNLRELAGVEIHDSKPLIGKNVFLHESGIHQDGMLKSALTYQAIDPGIIGRNIHSNLILGKHCSKKIFDAYFLEPNEKSDTTLYFSLFKDLLSKENNLNPLQLVKILKKLKKEMKCQ